MARNVGGFAIEISAKDARFARCREYIWTRLSGKRGTIDLLFRIEAATQTGRGASSFIPQENMRSIG